MSNVWRYRPHEIKDSLLRQAFRHPTASTLLSVRLLSLGSVQETVLLHLWTSLTKHRHGHTQWSRSEDHPLGTIGGIRNNATVNARSHTYRAVLSWFIVTYISETKKLRAAQQRPHTPSPFDLVGICSPPAPPPSVERRAAASTSEESSRHASSGATGAAWGG